MLRAAGPGWRRALTLPSLPESHRTIPILSTASWFRKMLAFAGPGYLIAVGYMDPGNWATDLGGGSRFGYTLLSVVLLSSLVAMFLQALSAKLGIATGRDLAQACREHYSRRMSIFPVGDLRNRDCCLRSGGSAGIGGCAETAVSCSAALRSDFDRRGYSDCPGAARTRFPLDRGVGGHADSDDRGDASRTKFSSRSRYGCKPRADSCRARKSCETARCCTSPSGYWARR